MEMCFLVNWKIESYTIAIPLNVIEFRTLEVYISPAKRTFYVWCGVVWMWEKVKCLGTVLWFR